VTPALMNDHLTGYLMAIAVVAALAEREEKGGYWRVDTSLTRCSTFGTELVEPVDAEQYAPISVQDLIDHGVDQDSPWGTFTRFTPPVEFSHTPSMALRAPSWPGTDPDTIGCTANPAGAAPPKCHAVTARAQAPARHLTLWGDRPDCHSPPSERACLFPA